MDHIVHIMPHFEDHYTDVGLRTCVYVVCPDCKIGCLQAINVLSHDHVEEILLYNFLPCLYKQLKLYL